MASGGLCEFVDDRFRFAFLLAYRLPYRLGFLYELGSGGNTRGFPFGTHCSHCAGDTVFLERFGHTLANIGLVGPRFLGRVHVPVEIGTYVFFVLGFHLPVSQTFTGDYNKLLPDSFVELRVVKGNPLLSTKSSSCVYEGKSPTRSV